jgi:AcrR family transcriptional regulator
MVRVSKDPAVRRQELVQAACELFETKGFEQVSVSDIVHKVGVAQGTFYYYFKTKYDVLDAAVDYYVQESTAVFKHIADDPALTALEKLQAIINYAIKAGKPEKSFVRFLHSDEDLITRQKYVAKYLEMAIPPITSILEEGIEAGLFRVRYPRETVGLMVCMYGYLQDFLIASRDREEYDRKMLAAEDVFEKVLGVEDGAIRLLG